MTRDDAIAYCDRHMSRYIKGFDNVSEGMRSFECLAELIESGTIVPEQLPEYGMDLDWDTKPVPSNGAN